MLDSKLYNGCAHPSYITNKYTGELIYTECGKCAYCLTKRSRGAAMRVTYNARKYNYCYFVTLDFAPKYLPLLRAYVVDKDYYTEIVDGHLYDDGKFDIIPFSDWQGPDNEYVTILLKQCNGTKVFDKLKGVYVDAQDTIRLTPAQFRALRERTRPTSGDPLPVDTLPFANYVDFQNFIKRVKVNLKRLNPECDEKIHYYVVSEYGPQTLRPHFHMLLFFDKDVTSQNILQACNKSWKYGTADVSLASGKSISYVAGYANSLATLPDVYKQSKVFKTRNRASVGFDCPADVPLPSDDDALSAFNAKIIDGEIIASNGKSCTLRLQSAYKRRLYPRFAAPDGHDAVQTARVLLAYKRLTQRLSLDVDSWDAASVMAFARSAYRYYKDLLTESIYQPFINSDDVDLLLAANMVNERGFLYSRYDLDALGNKSIEDPYDIDDFLTARLYRLFLLCESFFKSWHYWDFTFDSLVKHLDRFYRMEDKRRYRHLVDYYSMLEQSYNAEFVPFNAIARYVSRGTLLTPEFCSRDHVLYRDLEQINKFALNAKMKHKQLNDSLGIWLKTNELSFT